MMKDWLEAQGISANAIEPISPRNPLRDYYLRKAEEEFGLLPTLPRKER